MKPIEFLKEYLFGIQTMKLYTYDRELYKRLALEMNDSLASPPSKLEEIIDLGLSKFIPRIFGLTFLYEGIKSGNRGWFYATIFSELSSIILSIKNKNMQNNKIESLRDTYKRLNKLK